MPQIILIEKSTVIQATPVRLYKSLTDAKQLSRWMADQVESDPREGGQVVVHYDGHEKRGEYRRLIRGVEVGIRWTQFEEAVPIDLTGFKLDKVGPGHARARSRLRHAGRCRRTANGLGAAPETIEETVCRQARCETHPAKKAPAKRKPAAKAAARKPATRKTKNEVKLSRSTQSKQSQRRREWRHSRYDFDRTLIIVN